MSMFLCAQCDSLADSDEGCEETPDGTFRLICIDCMTEQEEDEEDDQ